MGGDNPLILESWLGSWQGSDVGKIPYVWIWCLGKWRIIGFSRVWFGSAEDTGKPTPQGFLTARVCKVERELFCVSLPKAVLSLCILVGLSL